MNNKSIRNAASMKRLSDKYKDVEDVYKDVDFLMDAIMYCITHDASEGAASCDIALYFPGMPRDMIPEIISRFKDAGYKVFQDFYPFRFVVSWG